MVTQGEMKQGNDCHIDRELDLKYTMPVHMKFKIVH